MSEVLIRNPAVVWRDEPKQRAAILEAAERGEDVDERGWVLLVDGGAMHELNLTAGEIWCLFDGARAPEDVAAELARRYDAPPDEILSDVEGFAADWLRRGWLLRKESP